MKLFSLSRLLVDGGKPWTTPACVCSAPSINVGEEKS
jgi:hypothetical protein